MNYPSITVSIVSHGHGKMVLRLLEQLAMFSSHIGRVVVTNNITENFRVLDSNYPFRLDILQNQSPLGFGTNHNRAFEYCETQYFCVMNPDIELRMDPFEKLLSCFEHPFVSIVAPRILNSAGNMEDSARYFPTPFSLLKKIFTNYDGIFPLNDSSKELFPDWVAGMFLLFPYENYRKLSGFDEGYFLYYEDVDICLRCWSLGHKVLLSNEVTVIHDAQRTSHTNFRYLKWHLASILRFFVKHLGRFPRKRALA